MKTLKIDGDRLKNMFIFGVYILNKNKEELDSLNIFPVPDGDTGTNMSLTAAAAEKELKKLGKGCGCDDVAAAAASGSLRGARGNSGVILSQLFRGLSKGLKNKKEITTDDFAQALQRSQEIAYKAVMKPKEGTVLTVARESAEKAVELAQEPDFDKFFIELIAHAHSVLKRTTNMLPALKAAGVVDAGGKGLVYIYEGMREGLFKDAPISEANAAAEVTYSAVAQTESVNIEFVYCTEFFIESGGVTEKQMDGLKDFLIKTGDSVVAVNDEEIVKIHVHSNNPGVILEYALNIGPLSNIKIENMCIQHTSIINQNGGTAEKANNQNAYMSGSKTDKTNKNIGIIAVSAGEGINSIFMDLGCDGVITGGQTMNPSADDILKAADAVGKENIIILPNNKNIILAAKQAADILMADSSKRALVLETTSIPEGISAMIAMVQDRPLDETAALMSEGAESVKTGLVTEAVRDTEIDEKTIKRGDYLGMIDGKIQYTGDTSFSAAKQIIDEFVTEHELISIYYGEGGSEEEGRSLCDYICAQGLESELQYGGQPIYAYYISAE